mgnify:CR=1 FL=1
MSKFIDHETILVGTLFPICRKKKLKPSLKTNIEREMMVETTTATTSRRDSGELPFAIHPVADLVVNVTLPTEVQAEIDSLHQLSVVVHVIGGLPSCGELCHLMQTRFQEEVHQIVDV